MGHKFLERKIGGHKIVDDQNVGSHKMTTDSVFILFKKTDFNTILACLGLSVMGGHKIFVAEIVGVTVLLTPTFCKFGTPLPKKMPTPLEENGEKCTLKYKIWVYPEVQIWVLFENTFTREETNSE